MPKGLLSVQEVLASIPSMGMGYLAFVGSVISGKSHSCFAEKMGRCYDSSYLKVASAGPGC